MRVRVATVSLQLATISGPLVTISVPARPRGRERRSRVGLERDQRAGAAARWAGALSVGI